MTILRSLASIFSQKIGFSSEEQTIIKNIQKFTLTSDERIVGLIHAVQYLTLNRIPGDFVECGVWRGGSMMAAMLTLLAKGDVSRNFYLFDTYKGMTDPSDRDVMYNGRTAKELMKGKSWCVASIEDAHRNLLSTGYPKERIYLIQGRTEDTLPQNAPKHIALLRLDTDWYSSTAHELTHLYPRLCEQGILIIDDYGHWQGARQAVDEYFLNEKFKPMLCRMDYSARIAVKPRTNAL